MNGIFRLAFAVIMSACALGAGAATKTVLWRLPADWDKDVVEGTTAGYFDLHGGDLQRRYGLGGVGEPDLPTLTVNVGIPDGGSFLGVGLSAAEWVVVDTQGLLPLPIAEPVQYGAELVYPTPEPGAYGQVYPPTFAVAGLPGVSGGVRLVPITVTPYKWDGESHTLYKAKSLTLEVKVDVRKTLRLTAQSASSRYSPNSARARALARTINPSDLASSGSLRLGVASDAVESRGEIIIISPSEFVDLWKGYAAYRKATEAGRNFDYIVVNTMDIYTNRLYWTAQCDATRNVAREDNADALAIHHYLERAYKPAKEQYIILGAAPTKYRYDRATMVPARYVVNQNSYDQVCDMYYGYMDRKNGKGEIVTDDSAEVWDYNLDGWYMGAKNAGGGYTSDNNNYVDWEMDVPVTRVPLMREVAETKDGRVYRMTAAQIMDNFTNRITFAESPATWTSEKSWRHVLGGGYLFNSYARGSQDGLVQGEHTFFDGGINFFHKDHSSPAPDAEACPRQRQYEQYSYYRAARHGLINSGGLVTCDWGRLYQSFGDFFDVHCHGWARGADPGTTGGALFSTGTWRVYNMALPCESGMYDYCPNGSFGITNCVSMGEAPHLCFGTNPDDPRNVGGGLVTFNNSRYGWWGGYGGMSSHMEGLVNQAFLQHELNAGQACRWIHNATSLKTTGSRGGACNLEVIVHGDPLIRISPQYDRSWNAAADVRAWTTNASVGAGWDIPDRDGLHPLDYTRNLRVDAAGKGDVTFDVADDLAAARLTLSGDAGRTITLAGAGMFRTTDAMVVTNANLAWNVAGGAGRNGITFVGDACDLTFAGSAARYVGYKVRNVRNLNVSGFNVTFDSDKGRHAADDFTVQRFGFVGDNDLAAETNGWYNVLRSRNPAFIPQTMTIPVVSNRLELQTYNIGGSGDANKGNPLFYLTNAYLKVTYNPYWLAENFVRPTYMTDGHIVGAYANFGFGCANGTSGYDLYVWGKSSIEGEEPIRVNGELRIHLMDRDAELEIANPMRDGAVAGSVRLIDETRAGAGKVRITATQAFSGGVTVGAGTVLELGIAKAVSCDMTVQAGARLMLDAIPLQAVKTLALQDGATMVLPGPTGAGLYQIIDSATSKLTLSEQSEIYDGSDLDHPLQGRASEGYFLLTDNLIYWKRESGVWKNDPDDDTCWQKANGAAVAFTNTMPVVFPFVAGASDVTVTVAGDVRPGYVDFGNAGCPYAFVGLGDGVPTLSVESLASSHDVSFGVNLSVDNVVKALGGLMAATNVTAAQIEVATNGALRVTGDVRVPVKKVKALRFSFAATQNAGNVAAVQELRLFQGGAFFTLPVGTTIEDVAGQKIRITGYAGGANWAHGYEWVSPKPGNENESLKALVDGVLGSNNKWWPSRSAAPVWFTVVFPEPQDVITGYALRSADYAPRTPKAWSVYTSADGETFGLAASVDDYVCNKTQQWMGDRGGTGADFDLQRVDGTLTVHGGGTLFAEGDFHMNLAFQPGATLAVTNGGVLTKCAAAATLALPAAEGSVLVDASQATATAEAFPILRGFGLSPADFLKFRCVTDSAVLNLRDGDLYVVTAGIRESPYAATVDETSGTLAWSQLAWTDRTGTPFQWDADVNYRSDGAATVNLAWVDGQATALDLDIGGALGKLELKGAATDALTLAWRAALVPRTLVFSNYCGAVRLDYGSQDEFALGYSDFVAGRDTEIPVASAGSLFIGSGLRAIVPGWEDFAKVTGAGTLTVKAAGRTTAVASDWAIANRVTGTNELLRGTWEVKVEASNAGHEYPLDKEVRIGANGVLKLTTKNDTTGYGTYATGLTLADGGELNVAMRDTFNRTLTLHDGGRLTFTRDISDGNRVYDFFERAAVRVTGARPSFIGGSAATADSATKDPIVNSGIIAIRRPSGFAVDVADGASLDVFAQWGGAAGQTYPWTKKGGGLMSFYRASEQSGNLTIAAGAVRLVNKGQGTTGTIVNQGELQVAASNGYVQTVANVIQGGGGLRKLGPGTTVLTGVNAYAGVTTVEAGTLRVGGDKALGATASVLVRSGAVLDIGAYRLSSYVADLEPDAKIRLEVSGEQARGQVAFIKLGAFAEGLTEAELSTYFAVSVDGRELEPGSFRIVITDGVAEYQPMSIVGYNFPLETQVAVSNDWCAFEWFDQLHVAFTNSWTQYASAGAVVNVAEGDSGRMTFAQNVTVPRLTVRNRGERLVIGGGPKTLKVTGAVDATGSAAGSVTFLDFALGAADISTGAGETILRPGATGTLTTRDRSVVTVTNGVGRGTAVLSEGAELRFLGTEPLNELPWCSTDNRTGAWIGYGFPIMADEIAFGGVGDSPGATYGNFHFQGNLRLTARRFVVGNGTASVENFRQSGGVIAVTGNGDGSATTTSTVLLGHWPSTITWAQSGGTFTATNAPTILGWDGQVAWTTSGGTTRLRGLWAKRASGHDNTSSFTLAGGRLELGDLGLAFRNRGARNAALTLAGGTLEAYADATVDVEKGIAVTGDATVSAVRGATLTVDAAVAGDGTLTAAGEGTVRFAGDCSGAKLAGTFQIVISETQRTAGTSTALFTVPAGAAAPNVTVVDAEGVAVTGGAGRIADGKYHWVPDGKFVQPISTTISGNAQWQNLTWKDGAGTTVKKDALTTEMQLEIRTTADATLTLDETVSLGTVRFRGDHTLTLAVSFFAQLYGCSLTVGAAEVYAPVVLSNDGTITFTQVAQLAEGASLTAASAVRVTSFGNGPFYGTFVCRGFDPVATWGVFKDPARWHGTLRIEQAKTLDEATALDNYGNASSTLDVAGAWSGYLPKAKATALNLRLSGSLTFNNGYSTDGGFAFNGALSGTGSISTTVNQKGNNINDVIAFAGDVSQFAGDVRQSGGHCVVFGPKSVGTADTRNMIVIASETPVIASNKTWGATSKILVTRGGVLSVQPRNGTEWAAGTAVEVAPGGTLNLVRASADQKVFKVSNTALALNGGLTLNGVPVPRWGYVQDVGTITLRDKAVCVLPVTAPVDGAQALSQLTFRDSSEPAQTFTVSELQQVADLAVDFTFADGATLTLDADMNADAYRILGGRATLCGSTGATTVYAGVDTTLDTPSAGTLVIASGMKATVPSWAADRVALAPGGWLKLTGGGATRYPSDNAVAGATVELAGDGYVLDCNGASGGQLASGATLLVSGGSVAVVNGENGMKPDATLRVTGGTVTLNHRFICGQAGAGAVGAPGISYIDVQGGELTCAANGGHVYVGAADYTAVRLAVSGGRFSAMYAPYSGNDYAGIRLCYGFVSVSGAGVFAPKAISTSDPMNVATTVADYAVAGGSYNHNLYLSDGGTYLAPAISPNWFAISVTNGVGHLGAAASDATAFVKGPIAVDADCTLDVADGTVKLGAAIQGAGTVKVAEGATLDLGGVSVRNLAGGGVVTNSGDAAAHVVYDAVINTNLTFGCDVALDGAVLQVAEYRQVLPVICKGTGRVASMTGLRVRVGDVLDTHAWRLCDDRRSVIACEPYTANVNRSTSWQNGNGEGLSDHVQFVSGEETSIVLTNRAAEATLTFDTDTVASGLSVVSAAANALTLTTNATATLRVGAYDFSQASGRVVLAADAGEAAVTAGADTVLRSGGRGTLTVPAGACATVGGAFAGYANAGTLDRDYAVGTVAYETALVGDTTATNLFRSVVFTGSMQTTKAAIRVEDGDSVTFRGTADNWGCRTSASFDIRGGGVLLDANQPDTWFGTPGVTVFRQSGGEFRATANNQSQSGNVGFMVGYGNASVGVISIAVSGGQFRVEDTSVNFYDPAVVTLSGTGLMRAKGVFKAKSEATLTLADAARFELGALGWRANAAAVTMTGGTLTTFADATMENAITLGGDGATIAAHAGTVLTLAANVTGDHPLTLGSIASNDTGCIRAEGARFQCGTLTLAAGTLEVPAGTLTNDIAIAGGTLDVTDAQGGAAAYVITTGKLTGATDRNVTFNGRTLSDARLELDLATGRLISTVGTQPFALNVGERDVVTTWTNAAWTGANGRRVLPDQWQTAVDAASIAVAEGRTADLLCDSGAQVRQLVVTNAGDLAIRALGIGALDDAASTGRTVIDAALGNAPVAAGRDTVLLGTGSGLITLASGTTATVTNGYFGGRLDVGSGYSVTGPADATLVFDLGASGEQEIWGYATKDSRKFAMTVRSGTLSVYSSGENSAFSGRTVTADGTNAVIRLAAGDATGYKNGGTLIALAQGATLEVAHRDTLKTPLALTGGRIALSASDNRAIDLFNGSGNDWTVLAAEGASADAPTVSSVGEAAGVGAKKVYIREGAFNVDVRENARLDFYAQLTKDDYGAGGARGRLVKRGAGELALKAAGDYDKGTVVEAGTLTVENAAALGSGGVTVSGGVLNLDGVSLANTVTLAGGGASAHFTEAQAAAYETGSVALFAVSGSEVPARDAIRLYRPDGTAIDGFGLAIVDGKLVCSAKPSLPYRLAADADADWTAAAWRGANGVSVGADDWAVADIAAEIAVGAETEVTLTVDRDLDLASLTLANAGALTVVTNGTDALVVTALDDRASTGTTTFAFETGAATVTAGADTVLGHVGTGMLTIADGATATVPGVWSALSLAAGGTVRYVGAYETVPLATDATAINGTAVFAGTVAGNAEISLGNARKTIVFADGCDVTARRLSIGNEAQTSQNIFQIGGCVTLNGTGTAAGGSGNNDTPLLISHWPGNDRSLQITGGAMFVTNGVVRLGWDGGARLVLGGGDSTARLRTRGIRGGTERTNKGTFELDVRPRGVLELGEAGLSMRNSSLAVLRLSGGEICAYADAEVDCATGLSVSSASVLAAADGATLTVSCAVSGAGTLTVGSAGHAGTVALTGAIACGDLAIAAESTLRLGTCAEASAFEVSGPGTLSVRLTAEEAERLDEFSTNLRVATENAPKLKLCDATGAEIASHTAVAVDGVVRVRLASDYEKLWWNGAETCWTNAAGAARRVTEKSVLVAQDGDVIDHADAVTPCALVLPDGGAVTIGRHWNFGALAVNVPEGLTLTLPGVDAATMTFSGAGTLALDCGSTTAYTTEMPVANANLADDFAGALMLLRGQFKTTAPLRASVTLVVVDGAQLFAASGEWNNRFVLSGDGWGKREGTWDRAALRIEGSLGRTATVELLKTDDVIPAIGCYSGTKDVAGTLVGADGFRVVGGGTLRFTAPKTQAANLHGTVTLESGNVQLGSNSGGFAKGDAMSLGDEIVVPAGRTLTLHAWTAAGADYAAASKVLLATPVTLNGGTLVSQDGAYAFARVAVSGTSAFSAGWQKGWLFRELIVPSDAVLNMTVGGGDGRLAYVGVDAGVCAGTLRITNNSNANTRFSPAGTVFAAGTLAFAGSRAASVELRDDATLGTVSGASAAYGDGAPRVLTLTAGTHGETLQDQADGTASSEKALSLVVTGDVTLTGANTYSGTTTVAAGGTLRLGTARPDAPFATASQGTIALTLTADERAQYAAGTLVIDFACDGTAEGPFGGRVEVYDTDGATPLYADVGIVRVGDAYRLQIRKVPTPFVPPYCGTVTQDVAWTQADWTDASVPSRTVTADGWNESVDAAVTFTNGTAVLAADRDVYLGTLVVTNTGTQLTVANGAGRIAARTLDDAASTGRTVFDFPARVDAVAAGADTVLTAAEVGTLVVGDGKRATLGPAASATAVSVAATGWIRREGAMAGTDNFATLIPSAGTYEFKDASIRGNLENKTYYGRKLVVREGDRVVLTTTGAHGGADLSVCVCGGTLDYTTAATWFCSDVQYVQSGGVITFAATGDGTDNARAVIPGYTGGSKTASMDISGGVTDISKTSIRFDQKSEIRVRGTGTLKVKGVNGNTGRAHPVSVSDQAKLLLGGNGWQSGVGALTLDGGMLGTFEDAVMAAGTTVAGASVLAATNGTTLTVTGALSGSGPLTVGAEGYLGTVVLRQLTSAYGGTFAVTEGATLVFDLSSATAAWPLTGATGTVMVDVTGRTFTGLDQGVQLIAWNQTPAATFTGVGLPAGTVLKTESDGLYLIEQATPTVVPPEQGTASEPTGSGAAAVIVITPHAGVGSLDVNPPDGYAGKYEIPVSVTNVTGVTVAQLIVRSGAFDIAPACKLAGTALVLDADAQVAVGAEVIPVTPTLSASGEAVEPFVVTDSHAAVGVKTVPGLSYQLLRGTAPTVIDTPVGDVVSASTSRTELRDPAKPQGAAFYRIRVGK